MRRTRPPAAPGMWMTCTCPACSTVVIKLSEDGGTVKVLNGSAEIGQGSDTAMAMIAAEALGVRYEDVRVLSGDTDLSVDLGAYSSRQTLMTGHATKEAAEDVKRQVRETFSLKMDMPNMKTIIVESNEPNGPFGAKEVGEGAIMPTISAILNAVHDATGVWIQELPLTPERVFLSIKEKK